MTDKKLRTLVTKAAQENRRLVAPLLGFPGLNLTHCTVKLAQQNYGEHFRALKAIADSFEPDAIFPMMDLSVEANALGRYTVFPKEDSATVIKDAFSPGELQRAGNINIAFDTRLMGYVETMKMMSIGLPATIMKGAYVTGPYTLAGLLMGADDAAMATMLQPDMIHEVCQFTTERIQEYVRLLIAAGAQVICILEPSAVMLSPDLFFEFSARYVKHINESCKYTGVATVYHTCGNTMHLAGKMCDSGVDALSLDSPDAGVDLPEVAKNIPENVILIGNISPVGTLLTGSPEDVKKDVLDLMKRMEFYPNFILSTGCDLPQETPIENIRAFMQAGREYKYQP